MNSPNSKLMIPLCRLNGDSSARDGFTLIELLVVIGIIMVLAALAFPLLKSSQNGGVRAQIDNNLRQQYVAITAYAGDRDQRLPGPSSVALSCLLTAAQAQPNYAFTPSVLSRPLDGFLSSYISFLPQANGQYLCPIAVVHKGSSMARYYFRTGVPTKTISGYGGAFGNSSGAPPVKSIQISGIFNIPLSQFVYLQTTDTNDPLVDNTAAPYPLDTFGRHYLYGDGHVELRAYTNPPPNFQSGLIHP